jgi:hypothetical protein
MPNLGVDHPLEPNQEMAWVEGEARSAAPRLAPKVAMAWEERKHHRAEGLRRVPNRVMAWVEAWVEVETPLSSLCLLCLRDEPSPIWAKSRNLETL